MKYSKIQEYAFLYLERRRGATSAVLPQPTAVVIQWSGVRPTALCCSEFPRWLYERNVSLLESVPEQLLDQVPAHWRQFPAPLPLWHTVTGAVYLIIGELLAQCMSPGLASV